MVPRLDASIASAFRTSDLDKPNCRAIREGVIPALEAARTAFNCPRVNETATASTFRFGEHQDRRFRQAVAGAPVESDVSFPQRRECVAQEFLHERLLPGGRLQGLGYVCFRPSTQKDVAVVARGDAATGFQQVTDLLSAT